MANKKKNKHKGPVHVRALPLGWQIRIEVPGGPRLNVNADKLEDAVTAAIGGVLSDPTGRLQKLIRRLVNEKEPTKRYVDQTRKTEWRDGTGMEAK